MKNIIGIWRFISRQWTYTVLFTLASFFLLVDWHLWGKNICLGRLAPASEYYV